MRRTKKQVPETHGRSPAGSGAYLFEALEPRLLLSADPLGVAVGDSMADPDRQAWVPDNVDDPVLLETLIGIPPTRADGPESAQQTATLELPAEFDLAALYDMADASNVLDPLLSAEVVADSESVLPQEVLFVNPNTPDYERLIAGLDVT